MPTPKAFAKNLVLIKARKIVQNVCEGLGRERIAWHIENNKSLVETVPPELVAHLRGLAAQYSWAAQAITEEDFKKMLPEWVKQLVVENGEGGEEWLAAQVKWLREIFGGANATKISG